MDSNRVKALILTNINVYTETGLIEKGYLSIKNGKISAFGRVEELLVEGGDEVIRFPDEYKLIPGFIDIHIHGTAGADTMDATTAAIETMAKALPEEGTTSFLATTITADQQSIELALENAAGYIEKQEHAGNAEVIGIHLEGPFISPKHAGAQPMDAIIEPSLELFKKWQEIARNHIKLVTLAPEREAALQLITHLKECGAVASVGHSDATEEQLKKGMEAGVSHVTHMYNGMLGMHHREPGVAGTALLEQDLIVEMIVDGIHVHPSIVKLTLQTKGRERVILITDSMRAKGLADGTYTLGTHDVFVKQGKALLENGTLAGSTLKMGDAIRNMMKFTGCTLEDITFMASRNPAKQLGVYDRKGSIKVGKDADLVLLNELNQVEMTICRGQVSFRKEVM